jgi:hypothetical protein
VFAVAGAAAGDHDAAILDDVAGLLRPGALASRMERVPVYHPRRAALAGRVAVTAGRLAADASLAAFVAGQLATLRASPLGRWLGTAPAAQPGRQISLAEVVRRRGVVLFSLDRAAHGRPADTIANLVAQDATEFCTGLGRAAIGGDGLAWFGQCETVDPQVLAGLVATGADAGFATVLSTTSAPAVSRLAGQASVLVLHRLDDRGLAGQLAWLTGRTLVPADQHPAYRGPAASGWPEPGQPPADADGGVRAGTGGAGPVGPPAPLGTTWAPVVTGDDLCALGPDEFALVPRVDVSRVVPLAVTIPARIPARQPPPEAAGPEPGPGGAAHGPGPGAAGPEPGPGGAAPGLGDGRPAQGWPR